MQMEAGPRHRSRADRTAHADRATTKPAARCTIASRRSAPMRSPKASHASRAARRCRRARKPKPASSTRTSSRNPKRASTGTNPRACSSARCARSIRGPSPKPSSGASACASGPPKRSTHAPTPAPGTIVATGRDAIDVATGEGVSAHRRSAARRRPSHQRARLAERAPRARSAHRESRRCAPRRSGEGAGARRVRRRFAARRARRHRRRVSPTRAIAHCSSALAVRGDALVASARRRARDAARKTAAAQSARRARAARRRIRADRRARHAGLCRRRLVASMPCARSAMPHYGGLVNALLRRFARERAALEATLDGDDRHAHRASALADRRAPRATGRTIIDAILDANNREAPLTLRVNRRRADRATLLAAPARRRHRGDRARRRSPMRSCSNDSTDVTRLPGYAEGLFSVQDGAAQRVADLLDVCRRTARPRRMRRAGRQGRAHARARRCRSRRARSRCDAAAAHRAKTSRGSALRADMREGDATSPETWWDGRPFERILLDAPCSATGIIRRQPDIKLHRRAADIATLAATQQRDSSQRSGLCWRRADD